eukprot:1161954-Pelagomonas_calceolata.AAC.8
MNETRTLQKEQNKLKTIKAIEDRTTNANTCGICCDEVQEKTTVPCCSKPYGHSRATGKAQSAPNASRPPGKLQLLTFSKGKNC